MTTMRSYEPSENVVNFECFKVDVLSTILFNLDLFRVTGHLNPETVRGDMNLVLGDSNLKGDAADRGAVFIEGAASATKLLYGQLTRKSRYGKYSLTNKDNESVSLSGNR